MLLLTEQINDDDDDDHDHDDDPSCVTFNIPANTLIRARVLARIKHMPSLLKVVDLIAKLHYTLLHNEFTNYELVFDSHSNTLMTLRQKTIHNMQYIGPLGYNSSLQSVL